MEEQQDRKEGEGRKGQRALSGSRLAFRFSCILTAPCIMGRTKGLNKPGLLNRNRTWLRAMALPIPITVINSPPLRFKVLPPSPPSSRERTTREQVMQRQGLESGSKGNKGSVSYGEEVEIQEENKVALSQTGEVRIVDGVEDPCLTSFTISVCGISPVS